MSIDSHGLLRRVSRAITFARYMPLEKLGRRVVLDVRRAVRDRFARRPRPASTAPPPRADRPPSPLMAPRAHLAPVAVGPGWRFRFLHRFVEMPGPGIDWQAPSRATVDQLWRMNLHYMEYLEGTSDAQWALFARDWIAANPAHIPGNWRDSWNSYALSLRVVVWLQELVRRAARLPPELVAQVEASAGEQLRFLERNLETDLGGNHLIKNIKALLWASAYFEGAEADRWRRTGLRLLAREVEAQIMGDGVHEERSASYHAQIFVDLMECRHALSLDPIGGRLDEPLHLMAQATAELAHPDGTPVLFNDAGVTMAYSPAECLAAYEQLFDRHPVARTTFIFPSAGYYGLRTAEQYLVCDCGRIAPDDLPAHGHGDVLSFEWSVAGVRMIVDQGVHEYHAGERRRQSRAASSHNTLCFEGADQADFFGSFRCGRRPDVTVRHYQNRGDGFVLEGTHDGFDTLPGRPRHVRRFDAGPGRLVIDDRIEGRADRLARIGLLLHPEVAVSVAGCGRVELRRGPALVRVVSSAPIAVESAVWWPDMGAEVATHRLVIGLRPGSAANRLELLIESG